MVLFHVFPAFEKWLRLKQGTLQVGQVQVEIDLSFIDAESCVSLKESYPEIPL